MKSLIPELKQSIKIKLPIPMATPNAIKKFLTLLAHILCKDRRIAEKNERFCFSVFFLFSSFSTFFFLYFGFVSSPTILPSEILTTLEEIDATFSEWVTMMTSFPLSAISFNISKICIDVSLSRAPVGSSAIMISGSLIRALAMATLCF